MGMRHPGGKKARTDVSGEQRVPGRARRLPNPRRPPCCAALRCEPPSSPGRAGCLVINIKHNDPMLRACGGLWRWPFPV